MPFITEYAKNTKQPCGGYINPKQFSLTTLDDGIVLNEDENISGGLMGTVIDFMTRILLGVPKENVFINDSIYVKQNIHNGCSVFCTVNDVHERCGLRNQNS